MKKKQNSESSLEGWSNVIREQGEQSREREKIRREAAIEFIASIRTLETENRLKTLLIAHREGKISLNELFDELHSWMKL